jgi:hypothetical protein
MIPGRFFFGEAQDRLSCASAQLAILAATNPMNRHLWQRSFDFVTQSALPLLERCILKLMLVASACY